MDHNYNHCVYRRASSGYIHTCKNGEVRTPAQLSKRARLCVCCSWTNDHVLVTLYSMDHHLLQLRRLSLTKSCWIVLSETTTPRHRDAADCNFPFRMEILPDYLLHCGDSSWQMAWASHEDYALSAASNLTVLVPIFYLYQLSLHLEEVQLSSWSALIPRPRRFRKLQHDCSI